MAPATSAAATFREDDLDRLRDVERGVGDCRTTLAQHGVVLDNQSDSLARIEASLAKIAESDVHGRVKSLESDRDSRRRMIAKVGGWGAGVLATIVAALIVFFAKIK